MAIIISQREKYTEFFTRRRGKRNRADESALLRAADAFDRTWVTQKLLEKDLRTIVKVASHPHRMRWTNSVNMLGFLAKTFSAAATAIVEMSRDEKANVRFAALCSLRQGIRKPTIERVIAHLLQDKSMNVRWKAAQEASKFECRSLLPNLEAAYGIEKNLKTKSSIKFSLDLLRDGYQLKQDRSGNWSMAVWLSNGFVGIRGTKAELDSQGAEAIAADRRALEEKKHGNYR